jgi:formylglycine-generating enzyme required for sulfatase activity
VKGLPQEPCSASTAETGALPGSAGMVKISEGTYEVGINLENDFYSPPQDIPLDNFWIDAYELTNSQYQQYLDATGDQPPTVWPDLENNPVRGVTWIGQMHIAHGRKNGCLPKLSGRWLAAGRDRMHGCIHGEATRMPVENSANYLWMSRMQ